jgi:hypothetical protein
LKFFEIVVYCFEMTGGGNPEPGLVGAIMERNMKRER